MAKAMAMLWAVVFAATLAGCGSGAAVGAKCTENSECASGACGGTVDCGPHCVCTQDSDCPSGKKCGMTTDCGKQCN